MEFNKRSRQANALLASSSGVLLQLVQILGNFVYRTVFLMFLTKEHLGINGLFTNILQLFSLAELGIGSAILYSMYKPFAQQDVNKIGALIRFYKKIYNGLAVLVVVMGLALYPFIGHLVDISQLPPDVNLSVVYFLFVIRSAASYLFVYKQSLLTADQQNHKISLFSCGLQTASYGIKIGVLFLTKDFHWMLLADIGLSILLNGAFSFWITRRYKAIFDTEEKITRDDKKGIFAHTYGLLCHRVGYIVVTGTDNIILSKFVSLVAVGLYSNYATLITAITNVLARIMSGLVPTIANYTLKKTKEESYGLFRRVLFIDLWLSSFTTVCLFLLLNPFITLWLDESFLLPPFAVVFICLQHYLQTARLAAGKFVESCGLFHLDKARPLIEGAINLAVSIVLARVMGIAGVFIGTCVSGALTYFWREPYLLHRRFFGKSTGQYWRTQLFWLALTALMCWSGSLLLEFLGNDLWGFLGKMAIAVIAPNVLIVLLTAHTQEFRFVLQTILQKLPVGRKK